MHVQAFTGIYPAHYSTINLKKKKNDVHTYFFCLEMHYHHVVKCSTCTMPVRTDVRHITVVLVVSWTGKSR